MQDAHKSSADGNFLIRTNGGIAALIGLAVLFLISLPGAGMAGPYPVPGPDDDPNHCSGRKNQPVFYCVTPPAGAHCEEIMAESSPLYLGYRYECLPPAEESGSGNR
jgi:hypothetical protein